MTEEKFSLSLHVILFLLTESPTLLEWLSDIVPLRLIQPVHPHNKVRKTAGLSYLHLYSIFSFGQWPIVSHSSPNSHRGKVGSCLYKENSQKFSLVSFIFGHFKQTSWCKHVPTFTHLALQQNITIYKQYSKTVTEDSLYFSVTESELRSHVTRSKTDISEMALHE